MPWLALQKDYGLLMKRTRLTQVRQINAGSGLYGSTKALDNSVQASIRKIQRKASKVARSLYAKDPKSSEFLAMHAKKSKSASAQMLVNAIKELAPKFASEMDKTASWGMYGFPKKTVTRSLGACAEMKDFAGSVASDLHRRKHDKYDMLLSYLKAHKKETKCPCTSAILQYYPSRDMRFASQTEEPLRDSLIRLANEKPHLRPHLKPLIGETPNWIYWSDWN
jgi:hypothetical protein